MPRGSRCAIDALLQALEIAPEEFEPVLRGLALRYGEGRGVRLMRYEESLQLCTRPQYREILEKVLQPVRRQTLTQAALETLAVGGLPPAHHAHGGRADPRVQCDRAMATLVPLGADRGAAAGRRRSAAPSSTGRRRSSCSTLRSPSLEELPKLMPVETQGDDLIDFGGV